MDITSLLSGPMSSVIANSLASKLNIDSSKAKWIITAGVPLMIAALNYNAKNKNQGDSISNALNDHSGGIFDNLTGLFTGKTETEGNKILGHIFGNNAGFVTDNLSQKSGLSSNQVGSAMAFLAPMVMGMLGQQKQSQGSGVGVGDLIGGLLGGGASKSSGGMLGSLMSSVLGGGKPAASSGGMDMLTNLAGEFFNQKSSTQQRGSVLDSITGLFG